MGSQRQLQKEATRQKILAAAAEVFARQGFQTTRMEDVAQAAGVSHGAVFVHFHSQDELICAVIQDVGDQIAYRTHQLASNSADLQAVLSVHLAGIREYETFYTRLALEARFLPPAARTTLVSIQSAISYHISQAAEREATLGRLRPIPVALLFNTWLGLIHYYLTNGDLFAPDGRVIERYGDTLVEYFMNLVSQENNPSHEWRVPK